MALILPPPFSRNHGIASLLVFALFISTTWGQTLNPPGPGPVDQYPYPRLNSSMAVIVVILIAAVFFMGFFSIYIRHCSRLGPDGSIRPQTLQARRTAARPRGVEADVINTFPVFVYSDVKDLKIGKGALECAVCLCEFEGDETLRLIPKCDHVFHTDCIDAWLAAHITCPVCRADLGPEKPETVIPTGVEIDVESQHDVVQSGSESYGTENAVSGLHEIVGGGSVNRTRRSLSGPARVKFIRSHTTGHSLVQPGENMERFTLRLPVDVRKQIVMNSDLNRVPVGEGSSRRGYRTGSDGSSRGKRSIERFDRVKSDRWVFLKTPSFLWRASTISSVKSPKVSGKDGERMSGPLFGSGMGSSSRLPV